MKMMKIYNKLVRDKIPEILDSKNIKYEHDILNDSDYKVCLYAKLFEEAIEFNKEPSLEELADVQEVIDSILKFLKVDKKELQKVMDKKVKERGSFNNRIYLEKVFN